MAATAKEQSLGAKPTALAVVFVLLALFRASISLLDAVYFVHLPFGAPMEFSDRESSPDPSRSDGSHCTVNVKVAISARNTHTDKLSNVSSSLQCFVQKLNIRHIRRSSPFQF